MTLSRLEQIRHFLFSPFLNKGQLFKPLLLIFLGINLIVLRNAVFHDPAIGYDAWAYYDYIRVLSEGRLPTSADTPEFFSPPLPFIPASMTYRALQGLQPAPFLNPPNEAAPIATWLYHRFFYSMDDFPAALVGKMTQLLNVVYSLVVTFFLLKICDLLRPADMKLKTYTLLLLGLVPVYYRVYAFVRAEPLMIAVIVGCFYALLSIWKQRRLTLSSVAMLGILAGLGMLTRQWFASTLLTLALGLLVMCWHLKLPWQQVFKVLLVFGVLVIAIAGFFYLHLQQNEGTVAAFNQPFIGVSLQSEWTYYLESGLDMLFSDPIRSSLGVRFLPMLYADTWGDYWAYFTVYGRDTRSGRFLYGTSLDSTVLTPEEVASGERHLETNRFTINTYLSRVNMVAILPSAILLSGVGLGAANTWRFFRQKNQRQELFGNAIFTAFIFISLAIYFAFLLFFTYDTPGTIKTGYFLHIFPFLAILGAEFMLRVEQRLGKSFVVVLVLLSLVAVHNFPTFLSNQVLWP